MLLACALTLAGCAVGPTYERPEVATPTAFKEGEGAWVAAAPADQIEKGQWWSLFQDADLDGLVSQVDVSNNTVAAAVGRYEQARALTAQQRASLFPNVSLTGSGDRSGSRSASTRNSYQVGIGASWEPDVWGRIRQSVEASRASEEATAADLANARLSAQGELAIDYFNLRELDVARSIQQQTIEGYVRTLRITQNRYDAGIVARTDVLQAQTQLANAQADQLGLERQRATLEHAIAVLVGKAPADFSLPSRPVWQGKVPDIPASLPSTLLQRRPDIAAAERRVAQANAQIGVAQTGYYPQISLTGNGGLGAAAIGDLFSASALTWAVGASLAQTLFNGGATAASVRAARAAFSTAAATYRQTVLTAFQDVEDQLIASRVLQQQLVLRQQASEAANLVEQQVLNRYQAGQVSFTDVITAQVTAATARRAVAQAMSDREVAAVALVQALGGGVLGL